MTTGVLGTAAASPATDHAAAARAGSRQRWRMSIEARAMVMVTAVLLTLGLAVLYSASALVAINANSPGHFFVLRQGVGVVAGAIAFMVLAKVDAEVWKRLAWPIMGASLLMMLIVVLPGTESLTGRQNGARRYLFGGSIQPSEFAKFARSVRGSCPSPWWWVASACLPSSNRTFR